MFAPLQTLKPLFWINYFIKPKLTILTALEFDSFLCIFSLSQESRSRAGYILHRTLRCLHGWRLATTQTDAGIGGVRSRRRFFLKAAFVSERAVYSVKLSARRLLNEAVSSWRQTSARYNFEPERRSFFRFWPNNFALFEEPTDIKCVTENER